MPEVSGPALTLAEKELCAAIERGNQWRPEDEPQTDWIAPGFAASYITAVSGRPKEAGKTTYLLNLCAAVVDGRPFLGEDTKRSGVIYVTEEATGTMAPHLRRLNLFGHERFFLVPRTVSAGHDLAAVVNAVKAARHSCDARLVVIDTLPHFAGLSENQEQDAAVMTRTVKLLQPLADAGLAVAVVVHERKTSGAPATAIRGSNALTAAVDRVLSIRCPQKRSANIRVLRLMGRHVEPDQAERTIELTSNGYAAVESSAADDRQPRERGRKRARSKRRGLTDPPRQPMTINELASLHGLSATAVREAMKGFGPRVRQSGSGRKGDPVRWVST